MSKAGNIHQTAIKALEEHGFLFQKRCVNEVRSLSGRYRVESEEYPVSIGPEDTVIDFVLRMLDTGRTYVVFECKRAHPEYVFWVFSASSSTPAPRPEFLMTMVAHLAHAPRKPVVQTHECQIVGSDPAHFVDMGLEVSHVKPTKGKSGRTENIYAACTQVLTGVGGLANEQKKRMDPNAPQTYFYIPVVITSAELFVTRYNPNDVDLKTGDVPLEKADTQPVDWVIYDFPVPEPLQVTPREDSMSTLIGPDDRYRRLFKLKSIAIVRATSIVQFLKQLRSPD
ncbi:MAG: hypothetical protein M1404_05375 [Acidobacteria bacterium]|nr:hypothetical protein [Acidobacteriota bacterium]